MRLGKLYLRFLVTFFGVFSPNLVNAQMSAQMSDATNSEPLYSMAAVEAQYLRLCGGLSYSKCDVEGLNQMTLFQQAERFARLGKKKIFIVFGADWCPSCRSLSRDLLENPELKKRIEVAYVAVNISVDAKRSVHLVKEALKVNPQGVPYAAVYDPVKGVTVEQFHPTKFDTTSKLVTYLEQLAANKPANQRVSGEALGVRAQVLGRPVVRMGNYGSTQYQPSTRLTGRARGEFFALMKQGMLYLHGFHWINAAKTFQAALKLEPTNPITMALLVIAKVELDGMTEPNTLSLAVGAFDLRTQAWVDNDDQQFIAYVRAAAAARSPLLCKGNKIPQELEDFVINHLANYEYQKADYLALIAFKIYSEGRLKQAQQLDSQLLAIQHYLTHVYETLGQIPEAGVAAEAYAKSAPDSPHAQHMYGHILPQLGKWEEALAQFRKAHLLHIDEMRREQFTKDEDWHYYHNLELYLSTLIYLDKMDEAKRLANENCQKNRPELCVSLAELLAINGDFAGAQKLVQPLFSQVNSPGAMDMRILFAYGQKNLDEVEGLVQRLVNTGDWREPADGEIGAKLVSFWLHGFMNDKITEDEFVNQISAMLSLPGFDQWSSGVITSRLLVRILTVYGRESAASAVKNLAVSLYQGKVCKTAICTTN